MADKIMRTFAREAKEMVSAWNQAACELHNALQRYIFIGETLRRVKAGLGHGEFEPWIEQNLPFGVRRAQCCMKFYDRARALYSPATDALAELWQEIQRGEPKAQRAALLPPAETQALMESEGAVEPEERETQVTSETLVKPSTPVEPNTSGRTHLTAKSPVTATSQSEEDADEHEGYVDADGVPIPADMQAIFATQATFTALAYHASTFRGEIEDAVDANPDAFLAVSLQEITAKLSSIRHTFVEGQPYLICPVCGGDDPDKTCKMCNGRGWLSRNAARTVAIDVRNPQRKSHGIPLLTKMSQQQQEQTE